MAFSEERLTLDTGRFAPVAAMLGCATLADAEPIPAAWQFPLIGGATARSGLRRDGFPGFGLPLGFPEYPRLLAGGRRVRRAKPLKVGAAVIRRSEQIIAEPHEAPSGPLLKVAFRHSFASVDHPTDFYLVEEQDFVLLGGRFSPRANPVRPSPEARQVWSGVPDATTLFQYSALSFNSHKIHLDRDYADTIEGYPNLVVNGGLTTLLLCEVVRRECGFDPDTYTVRNRSPLFCGSPMTIFVAEKGNDVRAVACDPDGAVAAEMEISRDGV